MKNTSDEKILEEANLWINANHKVALATVIKTWGSSPRQIGSKMIVHVVDQIGTRCLQLPDRSNL